MKMYPNSTIPRVRRTQSTTLRPISMRACPRWFVLCGPRPACWTEEPPRGEPADARRIRQRLFATALLPGEQTQASEGWLAKPRSVMSLCGPVLLRSFPLALRRTGRSPSRQDLAQLTVPAVASATSLGCHPCPHVGGGSRYRASLTTTAGTPSRQKRGPEYRPRVGASTQPPVAWVWTRP